MSENATKMENKRLLYLDYLKVIASIAVVFIHAAASKWYIIPIDSLDFKFLNLVNVLTRYSVPMFVMVTGVLILNPQKNLTFKILLKKYIFKALLFFLIGSSIFAITSFYTDPQNYTFNQTLLQFIYRTIKGPSHLWYLFMISGLYIITPFIRKIVLNDKHITEVFLVIAFLLNSINNLNLIFKVDTLFLYAGYFNITLGTGFVMYLVLGYYLNTYSLSKKAKSIIFVLGMISLIFTFFMTGYYSSLNGKAFEDFYGYLQPNIAFIAASLFLLFKDLENALNHVNSRLSKLVLTLSKYNLIIYILHPLLITLISKYTDTIQIPIIFLIPLLTFISYVLSLLIAYLLNRLSFIRSYF